jgi:hypothetical protein
VGSSLGIPPTYLIVTPLAWLPTLGAGPIDLGITVGLEFPRFASPFGFQPTVRHSLSCSFVTRYQSRAIIATVCPFSAVLHPRRRVFRAHTRVLNDDQSKFRLLQPAALSDCSHYPDVLSGSKARVPLEFILD